MLLHNSGFPSEYTAAFPATPALLLKNIEGLIKMLLNFVLFPVLLSEAQPELQEEDGGLGLG